MQSKESGFLYFENNCMLVIRIGILLAYLCKSHNGTYAYKADIQIMNCNVFNLH